MKKEFVEISLIISVFAVITYSIWIFTNNYSSAYVDDNKEEITVKAPDWDVTPISQITYEEYNGLFELPINGATGYAAIKIDVKDVPSEEANTILTLKAGQGFTIISESNDYFYISVNDVKGYILHKNAFINLPDVLPSIIYNDTNGKASIMKSSEKSIKNVTNEKLYDNYTYNDRLEKDEYIMPVLYNMAKKIAVAQKEALKNNETLIIYESYRPYETQKRIVNNLGILASEDEDVYNGLNASPWSMTWFVSTKVSNHQKGLAIDVSLGKVKDVSEKIVGNYKVKDITSYEEYNMPTKMHELSIKAVRFTTPVYSHSKTAWQKAKFTKAMENNLPAQRLQNYCTNAGLTPLASEWWHYNDLDSLSKDNGKGNFTLSKVYSVIPQ